MPFFSSCSLPLSPPYTILLAIKSFFTSAIPCLAAVASIHPSTHSSVHLASPYHLFGAASHLSSWLFLALFQYTHLFSMAKFKSIIFIDDCRMAILYSTGTDHRQQAICWLSAPTLNFRWNRRPACRRYGRNTHPRMQSRCFFTPYVVTSHPSPYLTYCLLPATSSLIGRVLAFFARHLRLEFGF